MPLLFLLVELAVPGRALVVGLVTPRIMDPWLSIEAPKTERRREGCRAECFQWRVTNDRQMELVVVEGVPGVELMSDRRSAGSLSSKLSLRELF